MEKKQKVKQVMLKMSLLLMIVVIVITQSGCRVASGDPIDADKFAAIMEREGYEVLDFTWQAKEEADFFVETLQYALVAIGDAYQFDFFQFSENSHAHTLFSSTRMELQDVQGNIVSLHNEQTTRDYDMYSFVSGGMYFHLVRIHNVVIFARADSEHRNSIREALGNF
jgi:hypothetical protein